MEKIWLMFMGVACFTLLFSGVCSAERTTAAIVIQYHDREEDLPEKAVVDEGEILLPVSVIKRHIYSRVALDGESKSAKADFSMTRFRVEDREINKSLIGSTTIDIPYRTIEGASYLNAEIAAKVFGFVTTVGEESVLIKVNQYQSFNPRILRKKDERVVNEKVVLAWQPTLEEASDLSKSDKVEGLNAVSPSWMTIVDTRGTVKHKSDFRYVKAAQEKGYRVWPLITNSFDPDLTHEILNDESARKHVIKQIALYAALYEFDGINLDFENIYDKDRELLNVFVKEIADYLKKQNLTVSIDVTVPSTVSQWSMCYDRETLSASVDYVMLMAYDEHWRTSPVSGSVASIGWVERSVVKTLQEVPPHKLVLGIPFYMREWQEDTAGGVKPKTMTMAQAEKVIAEKSIVPLWLEESGQYYFEYQKEKDTSRYRVWQEEERSLALKVDLVRKYDLAGVAAWRRGFEKAEVWPMIVERMQQPQLQDKPEQNAQEKDKKKKNKKKH